MIVGFAGIGPVATCGKFFCGTDDTLPHYTPTMDLKAYPGDRLNSRREGIGFGSLKRLLLACTALLLLTTTGKAVSEKELAERFATETVPFSRFLDTGERFTFQSADAIHRLSGVKFLLPPSQSKGVILIVNGRSESWQKYGELISDLCSQGYSVVTYDHRGQGLSPRLIKGNPQVGTIDDFDLYAEDLNACIQRIILPLRREYPQLFVIAHSMGAAVASAQMENHPSPFRAAAFIAPMFEINTSPYPRGLAHAIAGTLRMLGQGSRYAPGEHDFDPKADFASNKITGSNLRWKLMNRGKLLHPASITSGASIDWVDATLTSTPKILNGLGRIRTPILILQAGNDQLVRNESIKEAATGISDCSLINFPDSKHEILMESDPIRKGALRAIERFFTAHALSKPGD